MAVYLLKGTVDKGMLLTRRQSTVEKQVPPVERIVVALPHKKAVAHFYVVGSGMDCGATASPSHKAMDEGKHSGQISLQRHHTGIGGLRPDKRFTYPDG
jgi:hypothetical protein